MLGMDMMIKNMTGLDLGELQAMIQKAQTDGAQILSEVFTRMESIDAKCAQILENQQIQYALLRKAGLIPDVSALSEESSDEHRAADKH
jgi:hypothetical protein